MTAMVVLAGGNGYVGNGSLERDVAFEIGGNERFLNPAHLVGLEPLGHLNGVFDVVGHDRVEHQLAVWADGLARLSDLVFEAIKPFLPLSVVNRVGDLEGTKPQFKAPVEVVASGVEFDAVAAGAAEQAVHGLAQQLALEVPQRQIDAALGNGRATGMTEALSSAPHQVVEKFRGQTIAARQQGREDLLDDGSHRLAKGAAAQTPSAVLGRDLDPYRAAAHARHLAGKAREFWILVDRQRARRTLVPRGAAARCFGRIGREPEVNYADGLYLHV